MLAGRLEREGLGGTSIHPIDTEGEGYGWKPGRHSFELDSFEAITELTMEVMLPGESEPYSGSYFIIFPYSISVYIIRGQVSGQIDLRGEIMASLCQEIMPLFGTPLITDDFTTGQAWYDAQQTASFALQYFIRATAEQCRLVEEALAVVGIHCQWILGVSEHPLTKSMDAHWVAYDMLGKDGETYLLILRKEDNDFTAVLDSTGTMRYGLIDNTVLPAFYGE